MTTTLPSAGQIIESSPSGIYLLGFLKKETIKTQIIIDKMLIARAHLSLG
jgi:hypothetical protein